MRSEKSNNFFYRNKKIDFDSLSNVLKEQYRFLPGIDSEVKVSGITSKVNYPYVVGVILKIFSLVGVDLPTKGKNINTELIRYSTMDNLDNTFWIRNFYYPNKTVILKSKFRPTPIGAMEEFRFGLTLEMSIVQKDKTLEFESTCIFIKILSLKVTIPTILTLGKLIVVQKPIDEKSYDFTFEFIHPLFKQTYFFGGRYKLSM